MASRTDMPRTQRLCNGRSLLEPLFGDTILPADGHPGLVFDRYLPIWDRTFPPALSQDKQYAMEQFARAFNGLRTRRQNDLAILHERQSAALNQLTDGRVRESTFTNQEPLALSLGSPHPLENGASFDPVAGTPLLTGSAVKGLVRAVHATLGISSRREIDRWLGPAIERHSDRTHRGQAIFLDVYPKRWPRIGVDIINSHHSGYYVHGRPPVETESPVPVFFFVVSTQAKWVFRFGGRGLQEAELDAIEELLRTGLAWFGIGGKTAVGYGRMWPAGAKTADHALPEPSQSKEEQLMPTDPRGKSFLSYKRERHEEAQRLIEAQHERGIPTWQDVHDLEAGHITRNIQQVLESPQVANAVLWLTLDVMDSAHIQRNELPPILRRMDSDPDFFVVPVAAGGLSHREVDEVVDNSLLPFPISRLNFLEVQSDPADSEDVARVARTVLNERLRRLAARQEKHAPLEIGLYCVSPPEGGKDLLIDWSHCLDESRRVKKGDWTQRLIPAAIDMKEALARHAADRHMHLTGIVTLPVATMLGSLWRETAQLRVDWLPPHSSQVWSIHDREEGVPELSVQLRDAEPSGKALAVLVDAMGQDIAVDFARSRAGLPEFRAVVQISPAATGSEFRIGRGAEAAGFAWRVREAIKDARQDHPGIDTIHLFLKVPAGLAFLIGQLLNPFGRIQLYNHSPAAQSPYQPALLYDAHAVDLGLSANRIVEE